MIGTRETLPPFADLAAVEAVEAMGVERFAPEESVYELLAGSAKRHSNRRALWHFAGGAPGAAETHLDYESLFGRITAAANLFHTLGVRRKDVIGFLLPSLPELHELMWGGETAAVACTVNYYLEPELLAAMLTRVGAQVLVVPGEDEDAEVWAKALRLKALMPNLREIVRVGGSGADAGIDYRAEVKHMPTDHLLMPPPRGHDLAAYFHTGGTTGAPKFAPQTHRRQVIATRSAAYAFGLDESDVMINGLPHFHIGGLYAGGLVPLCAGATVVQLGPRGFRDSAAVANFWRLAEATRATMPVAIPTVIGGLLEQDCKVCDTRRMRFLISGASGLAAGLRAAFETKTGVRINEAYGLTEATFMVSMNPWAGIAKPASVGVRLPFIEICTLPLDEGLPANALAARGPTVFDGYLGLAPDAQPFRGEWLMTGDLARIDEEGHIFLSGRSKDLIKRGGHAIDPLLIEEALAAHPAVAICAAVGQPAPRVGELPVAYVKLRAGSAASEQELLEFAQREVRERAAVPKAIRILAELPKTSVGKVDKAKLRREATRAALIQALAVSSSGHENLPVEIAFRGETALIRIASAGGTAADHVREQLRDFTVSWELESRPESAEGTR